MKSILISLLFYSLIQAQGFTTLGLLMSDDATVFCEGNLVTNPQFDEWEGTGTSQKPVDWVAIKQADDAGDYVTENPPGVCEIHVDNGAAVMYTNNALGVLEVGVQYDYSFDVLEYSGSRVNVKIGGNWIEGGNQLTTGTYTGTITASETNIIGFYTWSGVAMMQVDNICITPH